MKRNRIHLSESQLKKIIKESIKNLLEYNDFFMDRVSNCDFLSDEDKKQIQIASMNNWDRHEREEKKKQEMDDLERLSNYNVYDKRMVGESFFLNDNHQNVMDVIVMIKEAYFDIQEYTSQNKTAGLDLAEAMGNLRGAIKILNNFA